MGGKKSTIVSVVTLWLALLIFALVLLNRQAIIDWVNLRGYTPAPEIAALSEQTAMSAEGEKLFYVHDPQLLDSSNFQQQCVGTEETIVLGCFDGIGIYVYNVDDSRLSGVEEVTAAHEMLHSAYERLSKKERSVIDKQLLAVAAGVSNQRLLSLFDSYKQKDASQYTNELHSIIGTEIRQLPESLETYYARYFLDRQKVVALAEAYEKVFNDLKNQVEKLDADLSLRKSEIDRRESELVIAAAVLTVEHDELDLLSSRGDVQAYNSRVPTYNQKVNDYNFNLSEVKQLIAEYNLLVAERNTIVVTQNDLMNSLNSSAPEIE